MNMATHQPLTLNRAATVRRVDALFRAMSSDFLLREQFITDPAQILSEYVYGKKLPPDEASPINHLIYSIMSSRNLLHWFRDRAFQSRNQMQSNGGFVSEFSRAVVQHGNHDVVHALIRNSAASATLSAIDGALVSEIFRTMLTVDSGTEQSTGGGGGTQQSGTHTTEHSTGGGGTRGWIEGSVENAAEAFLMRADSGTEQSPGGGGTQQSGTHTTEHSTGGGGTKGWVEHTLFGDSYAKVTLEALFQYAANLQRLGMLEHVGEVRGSM